MTDDLRIPLPGSEREPLPGTVHIGPVPPDEKVRVTVVLRRRPGSGEPVPSTQGGHPSCEEHAARHGAHPDDLAAVEAFAHEHGLTVEEMDAAGRRVRLLGSAGSMQQAFGTQLAHYALPGTGRRFRGRTGSVMLPAALQPSVMAVLGLDSRPIAKPDVRRAMKKRAQPEGSFTPVQVAGLYSFPAGATGSGQTIGIIELGGGYRTSDLKTYFKGLGMTPPVVSAVSVDGGSNEPGADPDADGEVMLDVEVAAAVAPGAHIVVYFADNTDQGFVDAISQAAGDTVHKPSIISISWGGSEDDWTDQARNAMNAALQDAASLGVTVTVAAGDNGATDGAGDNDLHVDFPASSPFVLSCGGTKLAASNGAISSEVVWNEMASGNGATGGGVSRIFALPQYQHGAGVPAQPETGFAGRGVPDVCGDADPETGYDVRVDGSDTVIGGTSAVAPLWAGLVARMNQQLGSNLGFINPLLYKAAAAATFHDIVSGTNGKYSAGKGWDACTGLGSPDGAALVKAL